MAIREVLKIGAPELFAVSRPVEEFNSPELKSLIQDLIDTAKHENGLGIAAPQIGVNLRVIYFGFEYSPRYPDAKPVPETVLINPEFEVLTDEQSDYEEGCLSVPNYRTMVTRYTHIRYWGYDQQGNRFESQARDMHARAVLHEIDHLDGILFPMRAAFTRMSK